MSRTIALLFVLSVSLTACATARAGAGGGGGGSTPALATGSGEPPTTVRRVDAERAGYRPVEGRAVHGVAANVPGFTAWFSGDTLRLVEERLETTGSSPVSTRYYYDDVGRLAYYVSEGLRPGGNGGTERFELRIPFDPRGDAAGAQHLVNGMPAPLRRGEVAEVRERGRAFGDAARDAEAGGASAVTGRWFGYEGGFDDAERLAEDFKRASRFWRRVEGAWEGDEGSGDLVAFLDDRGRLRRLEITYQAQGGTTGTGEYSYDERGTLFFYAGDERRRVRQGNRTVTQRVQLRAAVDTRGTVSAARRTVAGRTQPLQAGEIDRVLAREAPARRAVGRSAAGQSLP